ncbi:MAG: serine/threonine-protein kinase [Coleofasciculus chthonoplastes F3-SA18-01]|jgi:serine/threonine protein kinase|uniref:serine/threonine protein kinase n=1 Tax=Coleofasciculus chthonoplastes TaxID=64178 RepID=UPI003300CE02
MAWTTGQTLQNGKYTIQQELGRGRCAITYRVQDDTGKDFVVKTLNQDILSHLPDAEQTSIESKFCDEALKLERCKHPHIVRVYRTFKEAQIFCIVMEYIAGIKLSDLTLPIPQKEALVYIQQVGEALIEVHQQGLLHRDVKPENIMVRAGKQQAVLIDFDLAGEFNNPLTSRWKDKQFAPVELSSTNRERGAYTDVYSLAATLYVLLTGKFPATALDRLDDIVELVEPKTLKFDISERVNQSIVQGMKLDYGDRPQTMEEWLALLGIRRGIRVPGFPQTKAEWVKVGKIVGGILGIAAAIAGIISMTVDRGVWSPDSSSPSPEETK